MAPKSGLPKATMGWDGLGWNSLGVCTMVVLLFVAIRIGFGEIDGYSWVNFSPSAGVKERICTRAECKDRSACVQRPLTFLSEPPHFDEVRAW